MADQKIAKCFFCGGECQVMKRLLCDYIIHCPECLYISGNKPSNYTEAEAIAAHNRVSNAVATTDDMRDALKMAKHHMQRRWQSAKIEQEDKDDTITVVVAALAKAKRESDV